MLPERNAAMTSPLRQNCVPNFGSAEVASARSAAAAALKSGVAVAVAFGFVADFAGVFVTLADFAGVVLFVLLLVTIIPPCAVGLVVFLRT